MVTSRRRPSRGRSSPAPVDAAGVVGRLSGAIAPTRARHRLRAGRPATRDARPAGRPARPPAPGPGRRRRPDVARRLPRLTAASAPSSGPARSARSRSSTRSAASGLVGRGGAAFPTGRKWAAVAQQPAQPHYLVCNADESEPGTFSNRVLMEGDPFAVVEVDRDRGVRGRRGEGVRLHPRRVPARRGRACANAIAASPRRPGSSATLDIEIRRGAGAYICGEETALFESIEGKRGEPRNKPPFPVEVGLFGKPTAINNVETLVNVLADRRRGRRRGGVQGDRHRGLDRARSSSASRGNVARPGVYEVAVRGDAARAASSSPAASRAAARIRAVLLGGAAGVFVGAGRARHAADVRGRRGRSGRRSARAS